MHVVVNTVPPDRTRSAATRSVATLPTALGTTALKDQLAEVTRQLALAMTLLADKERECDELAQALTQQAHRDALTGLYNRRKFNALCASEITRHARYGSPVALIMIDIDHFKAINDHHGHLVGDLALVDVTRALGEHVRAADALCRWGGEEFVVLAPHTDLASAVTVAEKLRSIVAETAFEAVRHITCSFGVAVLQPGDGVVDLVRRADTCLYRAKRNGRNRVEPHTGA